ncbi:hypothetical protein NL676_014619 [Syzygium grande]|nr:hypothetical protein NL676_014619 [Syzygium grande]
MTKEVLKEASLVGAVEGPSQSLKPFFEEDPAGLVFQEGDGILSAKFPAMSGVSWRAWLKMVAGGMTEKLS